MSIIRAMVEKGEFARALVFAGLLKATGRFGECLVAQRITLGLASARVGFGRAADVTALGIQDHRDARVLLVDVADGRQQLVFGT